MPWRQQPAEPKTSDHLLGLIKVSHFVTKIIPFLNSLRIKHSKWQDDYTNTVEPTALGATQRRLGAWWLRGGVWSPEWQELMAALMRLFPCRECVACHRPSFQGFLPINLGSIQVLLITGYFRCIFPSISFAMKLIQRSGSFLIGFKKMGILSGQSTETDARPSPAGWTARIFALAPTVLGLSRKAFWTSKTFRTQWRRVGLDIWFGVSHG